MGLLKWLCAILVALLALALVGAAVAFIGFITGVLFIGFTVAFLAWCIRKWWDSKKEATKKPE